MRQLSVQDASFLYLESQGAHLHLTGLYIYDQATSPDGIVRHKDVLKYVESRLHTSPIFRQKLISLPLSVDYPYWVDDDKFDLEFHIPSATTALAGRLVTGLGLGHRGGSEDRVVQ